MRLKAILDTHRFSRYTAQERLGEKGRMKRLVQCAGSPGSAVVSSMTRSSMELNILGQVARSVVEVIDSALIERLSVYTVVAWALLTGVPLLCGPGARQAAVAPPDRS